MILKYGDHCLNCIMYEKLIYPRYQKTFLYDKQVKGHLSQNKGIK